MESGALALAQGVLATEEEKAAEYLAAYEAWLEPRAENTRRSYHRSHQNLLAFTGKPWWRIVSRDIRAWVVHLQTRSLDPAIEKGLVRARGRQAGLRGLAPATVALHLAAISSFYRYISQKWLIALPDGGERALFTGPNPALAMTRPRIATYGKSDYLTTEQLIGLLAAIRSYGERSPLKAKRDYALFLCYIATAARNTEVRVLAWGDIEQRGPIRFYCWANKGKSGRDELPADAWLAIEAYLTAAGTLGAMQPGDYLFTPLSDHALNLGTVTPEQWTRNHPLSSREVARLMKFYCARAGIAGDRHHVHELRHSSYMLYREAGVGLEERSRLLHHSSLAVTSIYDHAVAGQRNEGWDKCAGLLGL